MVQFVKLKVSDTVSITSIKHVTWGIYSIYIYIHIHICIGIIHLVFSSSFSFYCPWHAHQLRGQLNPKLLAVSRHFDIFWTKSIPPKRRKKPSKQPRPVEIAWREPTCSSNRSDPNKKKVRGKKPTTMFFTGISPNLHDLLHLCLGCRNLRMSSNGVAIEEIMPSKKKQLGTRVSCNLHLFE